MPSIESESPTFHAIQVDSNAVLEGIANGRCSPSIAWPSIKGQLLDQLDAVTSKLSVFPEHLLLAARVRSRIDSLPVPPFTLQRAAELLNNPFLTPARVSSRHAEQFLQGLQKVLDVTIACDDASLVGEPFALSALSSPSVVYIPPVHAQFDKAESMDGSASAAMKD